MNTKKTTYSIDILFKTICKNPQEKNKIYNSLMNALYLYQWQWQNASTYQKKDLENGAKLAIDKVISLLKAKGDFSVAESVKYSLLDNELDDNDSYKLNKKNIESIVKKFLKKECTTGNECIKESRYNKDFAKYMITSFNELCNEYPTTEAPSHLDSSFDPTEDIPRKD